MLGSVLLPSALQSHSTKPSSGTRRNTYTSGIGAPALPPRRNSLSTAPAAQTAQTALATARAAARDRRRDEAARGGVEWSALAEVVRMAEGTAGISLGRLEFIRRRA